MSTFLLEIVTPARVALSEEVESVYAPAPDGTIGILPGHMPLFTSLTEGEVKIRSKDREYYLAIGGGFMEVSKSKVTILVSAAAHAHEINEAEIEKARQAASEALTRKDEGVDLSQAQAILRRSLIELKVARRKQRASVPVL